MGKHLDSELNLSYFQSAPLWDSDQMLGGRRRVETSTSTISEQPPVHLPEELDAERFFTDPEYRNQYGIDNQRYENDKYYRNQVLEVVRSIID